MRRRRRYEVVVEGLSGQAASQRSVISDHRSEGEARENASLERARLEVIYGDGARAWRILVVRDDEIVAEEIPHGGHGGGEPRRRAAERAPRTRQEPRPASPPDEADPPVDAGETTAPVRDGGGPVPDWLIAQVEESIARQRDRTYGPASPDSDDDRDGSPRR